MIAGIDYGQKRIGVALSDETETIAVAKEPIIISRSLDLMTGIQNLINKYDLKEIVLGIPLGFDEKPTEMSKIVKEFSKEVEDQFKIKIILWNETLTSEFAKRLVKDKRDGKLDSESARIILQEYLDFRKETAHSRNNAVI